MSEMNEILKFNIKLFEDNSLTLGQKELRKYSTLMRESELLRIVKHLNAENTKLINKQSSYPFIKDIIIIDIGNETKLLELCKGFLTFNDVSFKRLMASSGNIRSSKIVFIKEEVFDKVNEILLCGLSPELKHDTFAKFSSYFALCSTDSIPVTMPRIVIIDDYKHSINEYFDLVKESSDGQYRVVDNQKYKTEIIPFDGAGLVDAKFVKESWCNDLGINTDENEQSKSVIPACWQFRFIPCGKGELFTFDIKGFAKEKGVEKMTDVWGETWDLFDENGNLLVDAILTKSQFKFQQLYDNYDTWHKAFANKTHDYQRTFNISSYSDAKHITDGVVLSYQPLQTLSLSQVEVKKLCYKTVKTYQNIKTNVDEFLKYRGLADKVNQETGEIQTKEEDFMPAYYQALKVNKELFFDDYMQKKIKHDLKKFRDRCCKGMLFINGSSQTLVPDLVGLAQFALNLPVVGVLKANQIYNQFWHSRRVGRIALCRFPHIAREWKLANVTKPECEDVKYLDYINEGYVVNIWDSTALRMGTADFDGDFIYGIAEGTFLNAISRQESRTILHIPPELTAEEKKTAKPKYPINNMKKLIETDCKGMKGGIGQCVNDITTLWSLEQTKEVQDYIKIMSVIGSQIIDYAKTGVLAETPKEIKKFLNKKELPYFMRYKYPKKFSNERKINRNRDIKGLEKLEKFNREECTVNRICWHLEKQFDIIDKKTEDVPIENFEWHKLLKDDSNLQSETIKKVRVMMAEFNNEHSQLSKYRGSLKKPEDINDSGYQYRVLYDYARNSLLSLCRVNADIDKILDYVLIVSYTDNKFADKAMVWNCFPEEMVKRVKGIYYDNTQDVDVKVIKFQAEKAKKKHDQNRSTSELVKIILTMDQIIEGKEGEKTQTQKVEIDVTDAEFKIYKSDIDYASKKLFAYEHKKLLLTLIALFRLHNHNNAEFFICPGKKNKITPTHICKLSDVDPRHYDKIMKKLISDGCIESPKGQSNMLIEIPIMTEKKPLIKLKDINDLKKHLRKLMRKAS